MNKLAIFPITHDLLTLLEYRELLINHEIIAVNSYKEDIFLRELQKKNSHINISDNIDETLSYANEVLLLDVDEGWTLDKYYYVKDKAKRAGKKFLVSPKMYDKLQFNEKDKVEILSRKIGESISKGLNLNRGLRQSDFYKKVQIPTIAVCGVGENCSKFEMLLLVWKVLKKQGYNVALVSGNPLVTLYGGYTFSDYLYSDFLSFEQKVRLINADLNSFEGKNIDAILIEIPGGIMTLADYVTNHFSEIPLVIANAIDIDVAVLNIYAPFCKETNEYKYLKEYCDYKYKIPVELICMSKQRIEYDSEAMEYKYMFLDDEYYNKIFESYCQRNIVNLTEGEKSEFLVKRMINILEDNAEFI